MLVKKRNSYGFTLIELMIVVAIIGILAAIAIPNFMAMQLRAKRSELPTNLDAIRTAEKAYEHEWDAFTSAPARPTAVPSKIQTAFGQSFGDGSNWDLLGWIPDGQVRGQYAVTAITGNSTAQNFSAIALSDIDGDNSRADYRADKNNKGSMVSKNSVY